MPTRGQHISTCTVSALEAWGRAKRSLYGSREGAPIRSTLGRIQREWGAASAVDFSRCQRWPEVYRGDALLVQVAIGSLRELPRLTVTFFYTLRPFRVPVERLASEIGVSRRQYWQELIIGETAVDTALEIMHTAREWQPLVGMQRAA